MPSWVCETPESVDCGCYSYRVWTRLGCGEKAGKVLGFLLPGEKTPRPVWAAVTKYPTCAAKLKDGSDCRTVVVSPKSDDPLERTYCRYHAHKAAATFPTEPEPAAAEDVDGSDADPEPSPAGIPAQRRGLPRAEIRDLAESSVVELRAFFADALSAERR